MNGEADLVRSCFYFKRIKLSVHIFLIENIATKISLPLNPVYNVVPEHNQKLIETRSKLEVLGTAHEAYLRPMVKKISPSLIRVQETIFNRIPIGSKNLYVKGVLGDKLLTSVPMYAHNPEQNTNFV